MDRLTSAGPTPRELGFRMPAEWEPHEATWLAWPHEETDWPGKFEAIPWAYAEIVRQLSRVERVRILAPDGKTIERATAMLRKSGACLDAVEFFEIPTDRSWIRDYGPIFIKRPGEIAVTKWVFNAWAKYGNWAADDAAGAEIGRRLGMRMFKPGLVLEGGSIEVNGAGLLLTTEECLLSSEQARNPGRSRTEIETAFSDYLGVHRVLWLNRGIAGDDTHGHIDDLARFVSADTIVTVVEEDPREENYEALQENLRKLNAIGGLRIVTLPMPRPVYFDGQRLPASYANFYIANGAVLVPTFNDARDRIALNTLAEVFPGREVVGISCVDLVLGLGTLHCMTQQQPAAE
jgi:agmatine deiminase